MNTRKREVIAALLISAALAGAMLMFSGCPRGPVTEPPVEPPTTPPEEQQYEIVVWQPSGFGEVDISPRRSVRGATISVTMKPNTGYEPYNLRVYDTANFNIAFTAIVPTSSGYTTTFVMPASLVRISVQFIPVVDAIDSISETVSATSSWEDIDALNALIKKVQTPPAPVLSAIAKLSGVPNPARVPAVAPAPAADLTDRYETPFSPGIIRSKMRNADLTEWISLSWPTTPITRGAYIFDGPPDWDNLGNDRTNLYYVKEDNSGPLPALDLGKGKGWQAGERFTNITDRPYLDGLIEIPLIYEVGTRAADSVPYRIWLYPVAQYTLQYEGGATGNVILQDYQYTPPAPPPAVPIIPPTAGWDGAGGWVAVGPAKILNANNMHEIGNAGKISTDQSYRHVLVQISTTQPNVLISVTTASGSIVMDTSGAFLINSLDNTAPAYFFAESIKYIIKVRPRTLPQS